MKHALLAAVALAAVLPACYHTNYTGWRMQHSRSFEAIVLDGATPCYVTAQGLLVEAVGGTCPSQALIEAETCHLMALEALPADVLAGVTIVFSADRLNCNTFGGCLGMTDGSTVVVHYFDWGRVLQHELFHILLWRETGDPDRAHFDLRWEWYRLIEKQR